MILVYLIIGAVVGAILLEIGGVIPGMLIGYLLFQEQASRKKLEHMSKQVHYLRKRVRMLSSGEDSLKTPITEDIEEEVQSVENVVLTAEDEDIDRGTLEQDRETVAPQEIPEPALEAEPVFAPGPVDNEEPVLNVSQPDLTPELDKEPAGPLEAIRAFIVQSNWLLLSGVAVLFIGLSLLVRLAIENQLFPLELRLVLVAIVGAGMVFLGSRLVEKRPQYGFVMEGGGLAVLYLTIFASFRLYGLLAEPVATGLLMAVTMFGVLLGLAQNAQWVAVISMLGGFLVPVLINSEEGNHVALFSYYAILNMGILATAIYKPWRYLNLTGFLCTFGIGTAWGGLFYKPEFFASIEPFLILFFITYLCIGVLYTLRHDGSVKHAVDGTLVFGLPVVAFAMQASLVEPFEYGISISSAIMGLCYLGTAQWLRSRNSNKVGLLIESFDGIGIALVSLFVPYLFDTMWTGIGWAIEGAALVWLGIRQKRLLVRASGYILAIGASIAFVYGIDEVREWGYFPLSIALAFVAYQVYAYRYKINKWERFVEPITMYAGLLFWLAGGLDQILDWWTYPREVHAMVVFSGVTAFLCSLLGRVLVWPSFARMSLFNVMTLGILMFVGSINGHPFIHWGGLAWLGAFVATYASLYLLESHLSPVWIGRVQAFYFWIMALLGSVEGAWVMNEYLAPDSVWPLWGSVFVPLMLVLIVLVASRQDRWPFGTHKKAYLGMAIFPVLAILAFVSLGASFENNGDGVYAAYIPILNPLDILLMGYAFIALLWYKRVREEGVNLGSTLRPKVLAWCLVAVGFVWLNASIARSVHHWTGVPYNSNLWDSSVFQTALSICWTLLSVTTMAVVARRGFRTIWIVAASLLAVVVVKLFVVDLSTLSTVPRIISFIGVGVLLLIIGYIAPVPPKREDSPKQTETPA